MNSATCMIRTARYGVLSTWLRVGFAIAAALVAGPTASAAPITWDGGAVDDLWSSDGAGGNWSGSLAPSSADEAIFDDTTGGGAAGVVTNVVDQDFTIDTLTYTLRDGNENSFFHTTEIAAGKTLLVTDGLNVAPNDFDMPDDRTVDVTITGADSSSKLQVGNTGTRTADILVGRSPNNPSGRQLTANLDLSALNTFEAYVDDFDFARTHRQVDGTITLATNNTIDANELMIGDASGNNEGITKLELGQSNDVTIDTITVGGDKSHGQMYFASSGSALNLGTVADRVENLYLGRQTVYTIGGATGVLDLTDGTTTAYIETLVLGTKAAASPGTTRGTLLLGDGASSLDINSLRMADRNGTGTTQGRLNMLGGTVTVNNNVTDEGGNSTIQIDGGTMTVGGDFAVDSLRVGYDGRTGSLTVTGTDVQIGDGNDNLYIARRDSNTATNFSGTVDLSGTTSFVAQLDDLAVSTVNPSSAGSSQGKPSGTLLLGADNTIAANTITVASSPSVGGMAGKIVLGDANTITADTITIGGDKGNGQLEITSGGTANLGLSGDRIGTFYVGNQEVWTGGGSHGMVDFSDGTLTAYIDEWEIARNNQGQNATSGEVVLGPSGHAVDVNGITMAELNSGGSTTATFTMQGGTVTVNNDIVDGGGTSIVNLDGGTMTVGGDFAVDSLRVGYDGRTGSLTVTGTDVQIGDGNDNLYIARRENNTADNTVGTVDLSTVTNFTANLNELALGTTDSNVGSWQGRAAGTLLLAENNTIEANSIRLGDSRNVGFGTFPQVLTFGQNNDVTVGTLLIGGSKSRAEADIVAGGTLNLGTSANRTDLVIGRQVGSTGGGANGTFDLTGGTFNASIDELTIGAKPNNATGLTQGTLTFEAGTVEANTITLGERTSAGSSGTVKGTLNFAGGTLIAGSILKGAGNGAGANDEANFNWSGGTLNVDQFGLDLTQTDTDAASFLSPGGPSEVGMTTVAGDYTLTGGTVDLDMMGTAGPGASGGYDQLIVEGDVSLAGALNLDWAFQPGLGSSFTLLDNQGGNAVAGQFAGLAEGEAVGVGPIFFTISYLGGDGNDVVLESVPEPGSLLLAAMAAVGLVAFRRRRTTRPALIR